MIERKVNSFVNAKNKLMATINKKIGKEEVKITTAKDKISNYNKLKSALG
jgi:hypothetical protein